MKNIDIDAVIAFSKELHWVDEGDEPEGKIAGLVDAIRRASVHLTSESAISLDAEEQKAMDHLLAAYKVIQSDWRYVNGSELAAAVHVLQGAIIQHMLHRLNPDAWSDWSRHPED